MPILERVIKIAKQKKFRVVMPELEDARILAAAERIEQSGLASVAPISEPSDAMIDLLLAERGMKPSIAKRMLGKPLIRAAAMVGIGEVDAMVAGAKSPTKRVIEAASLAIGLDSSIKVPSSFFLMIFPDGREIIFADCAVNVAPDASILGSIAHASENSAKALLKRSDVALLSFSTGMSGSGKSVSLVREVAKKTGFLGPIQADAALNPEIALKKGLGNGNANVLIFPNLDSGNIAYKLAQEFCGAQAVGPILQGFRKPVCDLSRGASVEDIIAATAVTIAIG